MSNIANIKVQEMERVLRKTGFVPQVGKGSHKRFKHPNGRRTVLSYHARNIPKPIVSKILKQAGISLEEFKNLRK